MFDNAGYPMLDENNFISDDEVIPEPNVNPVFTPDGLEDNLSFNTPLLSVSDNMFEQQQNTQDESYIDHFTDDIRNIKIANFASEAYIAPSDRRMTLLGYTYNKGLSNTNLSTYVDTSDKRIVISLRGIVPTNYQDLVSDIGIISADKTFNTTRLAAHKSMINEVLEKYPGYKLILSGHSLGGYLAEQLASDFSSSQVIVFNPGTSLSKGTYQPLRVML